MDTDSHRTPADSGQKVGPEQVADSKIRFEPTAADDPDAAAGLAAYYAELDRIFPTGFNPSAWSALTAEDTRPPHGRFLVMRTDSEAIGCGAVKSLDSDTAEIKRMWIRDDFRGQGLGPALLSVLEQEASQMGHSIVRLDTSSHLPQAVAMYRKYGYDEIEPYNDNPYAGHWFEKHLS